MKTLTAILFIAAISLNSLAASWRTDGNGYYPDAKVTPTWSPEENIIWKKKLPNWSNASPTINGDKIFVCSDPAAILCLSKTDGSVIWQAEHPLVSFLSAEDQAKTKELVPKIGPLSKEVKDLEKQLRSFRKIEDESERKEKETPIKKELESLKKQLAEARKYAPPKTHGSQGYSTPTPACDGKNVVPYGQPRICSA